MLGLVGTVTLLGAVLSGLGSGGTLAVPLRVAGMVGSLLVNIALYAFAFRVLSGCGHAASCRLP